MFKKHKEARALKKNKDVAELLELQKTYIKEIDEKFAAAEAITDGAEKILYLQKLISDVDTAKSHVHNRQEDIVTRSANKKAGITAGTGVVAGVAAIAIPGALVFPPLLPFVSVGLLAVLPSMFAQGHMIETKRKKLLEKNPDIKDFADLMRALKTLAGEMLDETVENCDLEQLPLSPSFKDAIDSNISLRERFTEATAKQALQEKAQAEQDAAAEPVTTQRESRPPRRLKITR